MSGLIWAGIGKGISDAGSAFGSAMLRSVTDEERQQDRLELARERQAAAAELQRQRMEAAAERQADRIAAKGSSSGGSGGLSAAEIGSGGADEGMIARAAGLTIPELRAARQYSETGNAEPFKRDVTRYTRDQDDGMAGANDEYSDAVSRKYSTLNEEKVRELPPGFEQEMRARNKALAKIEESYRLGKNYKEVAEGRQTQQEVDTTSDVLSGRRDPGTAGTAIAAGQGKDLYGGDSNVTRQKFTGQTSTTAVGESQITENRAQAGQAAAAARKSDAEVKASMEGDLKKMPYEKLTTQLDIVRKAADSTDDRERKAKLEQRFDAILVELDARQNPKAASPKAGDNAPAGLPKGAVQIGTSGGKPVYQTPDGKRFIQK